MHNNVRSSARNWYVALAFILIIVALVLAGCASVNREESGTTTAKERDVADALVGNESRSTARRAIIGAVIGGTAGTIISRQMDSQAKEIRQRGAGATVARVAQGIEVTFVSGLLYDSHEEQLRPEGEQNLRNLAKTFDRYRDTDLLIVGHTDSVGSDKSDQALSGRRARAVSDFLVGQGVPVGRLHSVGRGDIEPFDSAAAGGLHDNARVEVAIFASASYRTELTRQYYPR